MSAAPEESAHPPTAHPPALWHWRTSMHHLGIAEDPDMTGVRYLVAAAHAECAECVQHWATHVAQDAANRVAVVHLVAGAYTAATDRCRLSWEELTADGDGVVFGDAAQRILYPLREERWADMVEASHGMSATEVWQALSDALYAATLPAPEHAGPRLA